MNARGTVPRPDAHTLARAALTFCLDGADALMFATLKGAGDAQRVLQLLIDSRPHAPRPMATLAARTLDEVFAVGIARWGRTLTPQGMGAFHASVDGWHRRLDLLPTFDIASLSDWFTDGGAQWIIAPHSPFWPAQLADLSVRKDWAAPLCLWGLGDPAALVSCPHPVAVVGSRGVNDYGRAAARDVGLHAAQAGHLVVSGGAMGADAAAHWGVLAAADGAADPDAVGRTVAVFAGGLNHIGPQRNRALFERIVDHGGALVSELCPGTIPEGRRFLLRNRIIAAMASTVVVTQARARSGALNTANWAGELGREVYAVPGHIDTPHHAGCNKLIHDQRATLLTTTGDIGGICHAPHRPLRPDETTAPAGGPDPDPIDGHNHSHQPTDTKDDNHDHGTGTAPLTDEQRLVHTAIRRCRREHITASAEAVAAHMDGGRSLPDVIALLGEMELAGLIAIADGAIAIRPAKAGS